MITIRLTYSSLCASRYPTTETMIDLHGRVSRFPLRRACRSAKYFWCAGSYGVASALILMCRRMGVLLISTKSRCVFFPLAPLIVAKNTQCRCPLLRKYFCRIHSIPFSGWRRLAHRHRESKMWRLLLRTFV